MVETLLRTKMKRGRVEEVCRAFHHHLYNGAQMMVQILSSLRQRLIGQLSLQTAHLWSPFGFIRVFISSHLLFCLCIVVTTIANSCLKSLEFRIDSNPSLLPCWQCCSFVLHEPESPFLLFIHSWFARCKISDKETYTNQHTNTGAAVYKLSLNCNYELVNDRSHKLKK